MADDLPAQKARILAMLALQTTSDPREPQKLFDRQGAPAPGRENAVRRKGRPASRAGTTRVVPEPRN